MTEDGFTTEDRSMAGDYQPISCELYSKFELWIMRQQSLRIAWRDADGGDHIGTVIPTDMQTQSGSEFLCFTDTVQDKPDRVRLDRIIRAEVFGTSD